MVDGSWFSFRVQGVHLFRVQGLGVAYHVFRVFRFSFPEIRVQGLAAVYPTADFRGFDFRGFDFRSFDFRGFDSRGFDFRGFGFLGFGSTFHLRHLSDTSGM